MIKLRHLHVPLLFALGFAVPQVACTKQQGDTFKGLLRHEVSRAAIKAGLTRTEKALADACKDAKDEVAALCDGAKGQLLDVRAYVDGKVEDREAAMKALRNATTLLADIGASLLAKGAGAATKAVEGK